MLRKAQELREINYFIFWVYICVYHYVLERKLTSFINIKGFWRNLKFYRLFQNRKFSIIRLTFENFHQAIKSKSQKRE